MNFYLAKYNLIYDEKHRSIVCQKKLRRTYTVSERIDDRMVTVPMEKNVVWIECLQNIQKETYVHLRWSDSGFSNGIIYNKRRNQVWIIIVHRHTTLRQF